MPGNGHDLLGIPDIETLDVFKISYNTVDTQAQNEHTYSDMEDESPICKEHVWNKQAQLA